MGFQCHLRKSKFLSSSFQVFKMSLLEEFVTHPWGSTTISLKHEGFLLDDLKLFILQRMKLCKQAEHVFKNGGWTSKDFKFIIPKFKLTYSRNLQLSTTSLGSFFLETIKVTCT